MHNKHFFSITSSIHFHEDALPSSAHRNISNGCAEDPHMASGPKTALPLFPPQPLRERFYGSDGKQVLASGEDEDPLLLDLPLQGLLPSTVQDQGSNICLVTVQRVGSPNCGSLSPPMLCVLSLDGFIPSKWALGWTHSKANLQRGN